MGATASSQRRKSASSQRLDRNQAERRSLRSLSRKSHTDSKILRASSNQSLPVASNRPVTLYNASQAELSDVRSNIMATRSPNTPAADRQTIPPDSNVTGSSACTPIRPSAIRPKSRAGTESPNCKDRRAAAASPDSRAAGIVRLNNSDGTVNGLSSPFSVITSQELLEADEDYRSVSDFLVKHYAAPDQQTSLTRVSRINDRIQRECDSKQSPTTSRPHNDHQQRRNHQQNSSERSSFSLCDFECNRSHVTARDELNELNTIEYKLNCLVNQDRRRSSVISDRSNDGKSVKVNFTLSNGSQQESHLVSSSKASALIAERKSYLEKKIELESSHCQRVKQILTNSLPPVATAPVSPGSQPSTPNIKSPATITSTPSFSTKTRKPRALSLIESADGIVGLDSSSYANLMQDVKDMKTLLFRLQGLIHIVSCRSLYRQQNSFFCAACVCLLIKFRRLIRCFFSFHFDLQAESDEQRRMSISHMEEQEEEEELARQLAQMQQELRDHQQGINSMALFSSLNDEV